jgi:hypothetical protein
MEREPENLAQLNELWAIYMKMPVRADFETLDDFDVAMFEWCVNIENKFHDFKVPANHFKNKEGNKP